MIVFSVIRFDEFSAHQLYQVLKLRSDVFVVEQNCVYPDLDDKDCHPQSFHLIAREAGTVIAYARVLPENLSYPSPSIGRVLVHKEYRGRGIAQQLMQKAIACCHQGYANQNIEIGAQCYLQSFYASLGFIASSQPYDEDGIMHIDMKL